MVKFSFQIFFLFLVTVSAVAAAELAAAEAFTKCPNNVLLLHGRNLGSSTFDLPSDCKLSIMGGSASDITFTAATSNLTLALQGTSFSGSSSSNVNSAITFQDTVSGGSISISSISAGVEVSVLCFQKAVSNIASIEVKGVTIILNSDVTSVYFFYIKNTITGTGSRGSLINISDCVVQTSGRPSSVRFFYAVDLISGIEKIEMSGNNLEQMAVSGPELLFFYATNGMQLTGTDGAGLVFRSNSLRGSSVTSSSGGGGSAKLVFFEGPTVGPDSGGFLTGISTFEINGLDMRDCTVSASGTPSYFFAVQFYPSPTLAMSGSGRMSIHNVWLGGELDVDASYSNGYGAEILKLVGTTGVASISVTNSGIEMTKGKGMVASTTGVNAMAIIVDLHDSLIGLESITAANCRIGGTYAAAGGGIVGLGILRLTQAQMPQLNILTVENNTMRLAGATAPGNFGEIDIAFVKLTSSTTMNGNGGGALELNSNSFESITQLSSGGPICIGILRAEQSSQVTGFATESSNFSSFVYFSHTTDSTPASTSQDDVKVHCGDHAMCEQLLTLEDCRTWSNRKLCKWCPDSQRCVKPTSLACGCNVLSQAECKFSSLGAAGACRACPMLDMCLEPPGVDPNLDSCSCSALNASFCELTRQIFDHNKSNSGSGGGGGCKFCAKSSKCADADAVTECGCDGMPLDQCSWTSNGGGGSTAQQQCAISPETSLCHVNNSVSHCRLLSHRSCNDSFFSTAANSKDQRCHFCEFPVQATARGASPASSHCLPISDGVDGSLSSFTNKTAAQSCDCGYVSDEADCKSSAPSCGWYNIVPKNIVGGKPYCSQSSACTALTCQGIVSPGACNASGCAWQGSCVPAEGACFAFILDGFLPMTVLQLVIGVIRDVLVLFALGAFGDFILRPLRRFWRRHFSRRSALEDRADETIYILDDEVKDGVAMSFDEYVREVTGRFFRFESGSPSQKHRARLNSAVAFAIFDQRLWIPLDDDYTPWDNSTTDGTAGDEATKSFLEPPQQQQEQQQQNGTDDDTITANQSSDSLSAYQKKQTSDLSTGRGFLRMSTTSRQDGEEVGGEQRQARVKLFAADFDDSRSLQALVHSTLRQAAAYRVHVSTSRYALRRIAANTVDNPSRFQLFFYSMGILGMVAVTLYAVFFHRANFSLVKILANPQAGCASEAPPASSNSSNGMSGNMSSGGNSSEGNATITNTTESPSAAAGEPEASTGAIIATAFLLACWRICNASTSSTGLLVMVKVARAFWRLRSSRFVNLSLSEQLAILSISQSVNSKVLLTVYFFLLMPFLTVGVVYGLPSGVALPVIMPLAAGAGILLLQFGVLRLIRWRAQSTSSTETTAKQELASSNAFLNRNSLRHLAGPAAATAARQAPVDEATASEVDTIIEREEPAATAAAINTSTGMEEEDEEKQQLSEAKLPVADHSERFTGILGDEGEIADDQTGEEVPVAAAATAGEGRPLLGPTSTHSKSSTASSSNGSGARTNKKQISDWRRFFFAVASFLIQQEFVVVVLLVVLQLCTNATCLLHFARDFGLEERPRANYPLVFQEDWNHRSVSCTLKLLSQDMSKLASDLSSVVPMM